MRYSEKGLLGVALALSMAAFTVPTRAEVPARPGTLNYIEGQASLNGEKLTRNAIGSEEVDSGHVLETSRGKAEVLLTPGVFLRIGNDSAIRMISPGLADTRVELVKGQALVEATEVLKGNDIQILDDGSATKLLKSGLYAFNADQPQMAVFDGKAQVREGDHEVTVKSGRELQITGSPHPVKFDKNAAENNDPLYQWSQLRSEYLAEASAESAQTYVLEPDLWMGGGWYWNPFFSEYSFIPGTGVLYSPFGYGFYPPWLAYSAPVVIYRPRPGFGGTHRMIPAPRPAPRPQVRPMPRMAPPIARMPAPMHR